MISFVVSQKLLYIIIFLLTKQARERGNIVKLFACMKRGEVKLVEIVNYFPVDGYNTFLAIFAMSHHLCVLGFVRFTIAFNIFFL